MSIIKTLKALEIFDSRGNPTVEVSCTLKTGVQGVASVPSGVSTGVHEAYELRDNDPTRYGGKGVLKAVENVNAEIAQSVSGKELDQKNLDESLIKLDGTKNKSRLGANAILAVSLAFARAYAIEQKIELYEYIANIYFNNEVRRKYHIPQPAFNTIEGGKHSDSGLTFQEFLLLPVSFKNIKEKVACMQKIIASLRDLLLKNDQSVVLGDEGGVAPKLESDEEALKDLEKAIILAGYNKEQVKLGIDAAASTFLRNGKYNIEGKNLEVDGMIKMYENLCAHYSIISIEDGLSEENFVGFTQLTTALGKKIHIVGDDLTVTNIDLIKKAIDHKSINTLLVKPNQIGTLTETLEAIRLAKENNIKIFISNRGGETEDSFIADLAVAIGADFIKAGAPTKKERIVKYERLIEIENHLLL